MTLQKLQQEVDRWARQFEVPYWRPHEILARLMEETGELAREINHRFGPKKKKTAEGSRELGDEIGDIMFTLACLANSLDMNLTEAFRRVMDKCYGRDNERYARRKNP